MAKFLPTPNPWKSGWFIGGFLGGGLASEMVQITTAAGTYVSWLPVLVGAALLIPRSTRNAGLGVVGGSVVVNVGNWLLKKIG